MQKLYNIFIKDQALIEELRQIPGYEMMPNYKVILAIDENDARQKAQNECTVGLRTDLIPSMNGSQYDQYPILDKCQGLWKNTALTECRLIGKSH